MRMYEIDVNGEKRVCIDAEDIIDRMLALEMGNPNILENYWNIRVLVSQALMKAKSEAPEILPPVPPPKVNMPAEKNEVRVIE